MMARALALAAKGLFTTSPNPRVGCVIERGDAIVGEGWHEAAGKPHAEVNALEQAGDRARGGTAYVTLEPCSHQGRTPPCADALIRAGVSRVVAAMQDPNPQVAGTGFARLQTSGVEVIVGVMEEEARELNVGFVSRMTRGRPWVRLKVAASVDGRTALANGKSQWITGEAARTDGHRWRARACAVLTGIGTVRDDDPQLNVRLVETPRQPLKVLVDSRLEISPGAKLFNDGKVLVFAAEKSPRADVLRARGAEVVFMANARGKVDLPALLEELAHREINELHIEAGNGLNGSLLMEDCVDELLLYFAPTVLGDGAKGMFHMADFAELAQGRRFRFTAAEPVGEDLRVLARVLT